MMRAVWLAGLVWMQFSIVTVNYRAIALGRYIEAVLTDALFCALSFTLFKMVQQSDARAGDVLGYMIGGMLGSVTGIYLTRRWKHAA